jgi:hypothetical protein
VPDYASLIRPYGLASLTREERVLRMRFGITQLKRNAEDDSVSASQWAIIHCMTAELFSFEASPKGLFLSAA